MDYIQVKLFQNYWIDIKICQNYNPIVCKPMEMDKLGRIITRIKSSKKYFENRSITIVLIYCRYILYIYIYIL